MPPVPVAANHILVPFGERGSFRTLNGKAVAIERDVLTTGGRVFFNCMAVQRIDVTPPFATLHPGYLCTISDILLH